ncbi:hypothetical protein CEXT_237731 [Caerostris extrusa]|uniref:Uncharacterized protein n=1 Tax=Caerostris extrusa TaxID=172846 RepID=A0AAV4WVB5_CAEEX|nr:hypothetical protein CEXT_237731 [Caerostris extrusa]
MIIKSPLMLFSMPTGSIPRGKPGTLRIFTLIVHSRARDEPNKKNAAAIRAMNPLNWDFLIRFQFRVYSVEQNSAIILILIQTFPNRRRTLNNAKGNRWSAPSLC